MAAAEELDVLVIGSGIAGLSAAIALAEQSKVMVIAKEEAGGGSTVLAQGGIAAALGPEDDPAAHADDTVAAAAGLGDEAVAALVTGEAAEAVSRLARLGVNFDGGAMAREGGHGRARVVHARGDATGAEITHALLGAARSRGVPLVGGMFLVDLLVSPDGTRVVGAVAWDSFSRSLVPLHATNVVLATGGYGQLWASTTSPLACGGDGLAAALRAGAQAADLEFVQFHPTGMVLGRDPRPLASEALRGAGARLRDASGQYLHGADGEGDLAPRDVVSRSMARRMSETGTDHCFLDATGLGEEVLARHFPTFLSACRSGGLDPEREWVPVCPTAHYTMGGVLTDSEGRTTLEGLLAVGEVGCTGLHGANRLASNSLLEGAVVGERAARLVLGSRGAVMPRQPVAPGEVLRGGPSGARPSGDFLDPVEGIAAARSGLRAAMQSYAGVARSGEGLGGLVGWLGGLERSIAKATVGGGPAAWELANMSMLARFVAILADRRHESRGAHWRTDHPVADPAWALRQVIELLPGGDLAIGTTGVQARTRTAERPVAGVGGQVPPRGAGALS